MYIFAWVQSVEKILKFLICIGYSSDNKPGAAKEQQVPGLCWEKVSPTLGAQLSAVPRREPGHLPWGEAARSTGLCRAFGEGPGGSSEVWLCQAHCARKSCQVAETAAVFRVWVCVFLLCFMWRELPSLQGQEACVCAQKASGHHGSSGNRRRPLGSVKVKWLSESFTFCCFGRLCNDGKMIVPLFFFLLLL